MKVEFKTVCTSTVEGVREAERMAHEGWDIAQILVVWCRKKEGKK